MSSHNNNEMSENEQMYLVKIAKLEEQGHESPVALSELANTLSVLPVSVNQMIHKMEKSGLVKYYPYKGVEFTSSGRQLVMRILRYRRLWEVFLVRDLSMSLEGADALACNLEHITSDDVADRLSEFLGHPAVCYHGNPIPQVEGDGMALFEGMSLSDLQIGESAQVMQINADTLTTGFLSNEGISPGVRVRVLAIGNSGDMLLESKKMRVHLSAEMTSSISVGWPKK
ncbi:MAG: metal-dependent transcriptional regulator [Anaerolineales bacterium]|nr:metal-dependent transcriptional regulator [Anaerolineales bacterium]